MISIVFRCILSPIREYVIGLVRSSYQAIRWLLLRTHSIPISSTEGFKTEGEESETDADY